MDRGKYRGIVLTCVLRAACALGLANTYVQEAQPEGRRVGVLPINMQCYLVT